jgi:hypothetical protein
MRPGPYPPNYFYYFLLVESFISLGGPTFRRGSNGASGDDPRGCIPPPYPDLHARYRGLVGGVVWARLLYYLSF